ncbi:DEAD/DEAH box helicase [Teichococcus aestuarii]|uniref:DEAD/DEAH box helicase n=1 Tax=Teichococcus aestuarii TaxID=568898 RepID=UPI00361EC29E
MDGVTRNAEAQEKQGGSGTAGPVQEMEPSTTVPVCPLEADSSQLRAVAHAAEGRSFVLIGPPGTGKSQTIANIIANTLAQKRTVLFVAEKRAALEVVERRLRQVGLGEFCLDLFSAKSGKMEVLQQLDRATQVADALADNTWDETQAELSGLQAELDGYVADLHRRGRNGWTAFRAMGCLLRAEGAGVPEITLSWPGADAHDAAAWQRLLQTVEDAAATMVQLGDLKAATALLGVERAEWSPPWQSRLLDAARRAASRLDAVAGAHAAALRALAITPSRSATRRDLQALDTLAAVLLEPQAQSAGWTASEGAQAAHEAVLAAEPLAQRHQELTASLTGRWRPEVMALPLREIRREWTEASERWALPRMMAQKAVRKRLVATVEGPVPEDCGGELDRLVALQEVEAGIAALATDAAPLGRRWQGRGTDFERLQADHAWAQRLRAATGSVAQEPAGLLALRDHLRRLLQDGADLLQPEGAIGLPLRQFRDTWSEAQAALKAVGDESGSDVSAIPVTEADWLTALAGHLRGWEQAARHLRDWCAWCGVAQRAADLGLRPLLDALENGLVAPADTVRVFEANYARWWLGLVVEDTPRLRAFVAAQHEKRIERFRALDTHMLSLATRLIRGRLAQGIPGAAQRQHDPEYVVLTRELAKKQRHMPVRQLATKMPKALRRLTPCLMMSPLSIAQYLPADAEPFDLVIFDEASQIPTWDAIGAIGRGRQVIVVGDPKQLPPTSFFSRQIAVDEEEAEGPDGTLTITQDLESILDECLGAGIPSTELTGTTAAATRA